MKEMGTAIGKELGKAVGEELSLFLSKSYSKELLEMAGDACFPSIHSVQQVFFFLSH